MKLLGRRVCHGVYRKLMKRLHSVQMSISIYQAIHHLSPAMQHQQLPWPCQSEHKTEIKQELKVTTLYVKINACKHRASNNWFDQRYHYIIELIAGLLTSALSRGSVSLGIYFRASPFSSASMQASTNGR